MRLAPTGSLFLTSEALTQFGELCYDVICGAVMCCTALLCLPCSTQQVSHLADGDHVSLPRNQTTFSRLTALASPLPLQMTDVLRRYPDAAEACVEAVAAIPEEVCAFEAVTV